MGWGRGGDWGTCLEDAEAGAGSVRGGEVEGWLPVGDVKAGDLGGGGGVCGRQQGEGEGDERGLHLGKVSIVCPFPTWLALV
jgi:hypothetical protein